MFIGRGNELGELNRLYYKDSFEMAVIYGRRRVGKTSLINEFCKDKLNIFYVAIEQNNKGALESFSEKVLEILPEASSFIDVFISWEKAFEYIANQSKNQRIILAIDEYPYIATGDQSISSVLQKIIDTKFLSSKLFLILCGSSMSFMENQVLGYKSPLYGRRTAQFKIEPFDYIDSRKFFPQYSLEEQVIAYGVVGGIPQYLSNLSKESNLIDGIYYNYFRKDGHLFEETSSILKQELREPAMYNSIITAVAYGASRLNEIATKTGEESKKCSKYLSTLIDLHIVRKEYPVGVEVSRSGIYSLCDNMFKFWYKFIPENMTNIEAGMGKIIIDKKVIPQLSDYIGRIFEEICIQYMIRRNKTLSLSIMFDMIGRWWGNNPIKKMQEEIDILAKSGNMAIFGECKWRNELLGVSVLNSLIEKSGVLTQYEDKYYILFSKSGFTIELLDIVATMDNVELVDLNRLYAIE
ncbi:MAG TPA: ATP-binding protein [Clostridiaceae bacterium]